MVSQLIKKYFRAAMLLEPYIFRLFTVNTKKMRKTKFIGYLLFLNIQMNKVDKYYSIYCQTYNMKIGKIKINR